MDSTTVVGTHAEAHPELAVDASAPVLDVVIPVYNEAAGLEIAQRLAAELSGVRVVHLDARGRGSALHTAWLASSQC